MDMTGPSVSFAWGSKSPSHATV